MTYSPLDLVENFLRRFVAYPSEHALVAHTLWIAHTHLIECFDTTPRLAFMSAEKESGKTRALEISDLFARDPLMAFCASSAVLIRLLAERRRTLLYDEIDSVFGNAMRQEANGELCAFMNAGYRRGAKSHKCSTGTKKIKAEEFDAFACVAVPAGIEDRAADIWEPLLAIAEEAGDDWPKRARAAAVYLTHNATDESLTTGVELLGHILEAFGGEDNIFTSTLLDRLCDRDESPWKDIRGKPLTDRGLASRLKDYGIKSKPVRVADKVLKGYHAADFADSWTRYIMGYKGYKGYKIDNQNKNVTLVTHVTHIERRERLPNLAPHMTPAEPAMAVAALPANLNSSAFPGSEVRREASKIWVDPHHTTAAPTGTVKPPPKTTTTSLPARTEDDREG